MASRSSRVLQFIITGDAKSLNRAFGQVEKDAKNAGKHVSGFGSAAHSAFKLAGEAFAGAEIAHQLKETVDAAKEAQVAHAKLATQLKAVGISYGAHSKQITEVIDKTSALSGITGKDLEGALTSVVRGTGNLKDGLRGVAIAADLARAKHMDVAKAGDLVAKVFNGNVGALKRMGISLTPVTAAQDKLKESTKHATVEQTRAAKEADKTATAQKALALLQKRVGGQAEAYGKTAAGAQDRFRAAVERLRESIGAKLLPIIAKVAGKAADFVTQMQDGTGAGGRFAAKLKDIADRIKPVAKFFTDHPKIVAVAIGAWVAYRIAAAAAMAATRLKALGMFKGLAKPAAVGGAEAGAAFGTAEATAANTRMAAGTATGLRGLAGKMPLFGRMLGGALGTAMMFEVAKNFQGPTWAKILRGLIPFQPSPSSGLPKKGGPQILLPNPMNPLPKGSPTGATPLKPSRSPSGGRTPLPAAHPGTTRAHSAVAHAASGAGPAASAASGPARVAGATTDKRRQALALMEAAWKAAAPYYGRAGKPMPRVKFTGGDSPLVGTVWNSDKTKIGSAVVYWPDWMTDWLLGLGHPGDRDAAFGTLIHEWAHIFQVTGLSDSDAEGGAQAFARRVAPKVAASLGLSYKNLPFKGEQYQGPIARVKRKGAAFIMGGQFRGGGAKTASAASARARSTSPVSAHAASTASGWGQKLSAAQLATLWVQAGGDSSMADLMAAIALAESGGYTRRPNATGSGAFGLWQILGQEVAGDLGDPLVNAKNAVWKYTHQGLGAWEVYSNGSYRAYLGKSGGSTNASLASVAAGGTTSRPKITTAALEHGQSGKPKGMGAPFPKGVTGFQAGLTTGQIADLTADPQTSQKARNMRLFQIGVRKNKILSDLRSGKVKDPATRKRLLDELTSLNGEQTDLLKPIGGDLTGADAIPGATAYLSSLNRQAAEAALTPDTADDADVAKRTLAARQAIYDYEKARPGQFSDDSIAQAATDLKSAKDAVDQSGQAQQDLVTALNAVRDELKQQNDAAKQVTSVSLGVAWKAMADIISGQIAGVGYSGRALTAGDGSIARW